MEDKIKILLGEPLKKEYNGLEIEFYPPPLIVYRRLSKLFKSLFMTIYPAVSEDNKVDINALKDIETNDLLSDETEDDIIEIIYRCIRIEGKEVSKTILKNSRSDFILWALKVILTEVVDLGFFSQMITEIVIGLSKKMEALLKSSQELSNTQAGN
jgi:hypothetical protein